jgi:hypothetical protein
MRLLFIGLLLPKRVQQGFRTDSVSNLDFPTELVMIRSKGEIFSVKNKTRANPLSLAPLRLMNEVHSMGRLRATRRKAGDDTAAMDGSRHCRPG